MQVLNVFGRSEAQVAVLPLESGSQTRSSVEMTLQLRLPGEPAPTDTFTEKSMNDRGSPTGTYGGWLAGPLTDIGVLMSLNVQPGGQGSALAQPLLAGGGHVAGEGGQTTPPPNAGIDASEASMIVVPESVRERIVCVDRAVRRQHFSVCTIL